MFIRSFHTIIYYISDSVRERGFEVLFLSLGKLVGRPSAFMVGRFVEGVYFRFSLFLRILLQ